MNMTIKKSDLLAAVEAANAVADKHSTLPVVTCALIRADASGCLVTATDLKTEIAVRVVGECHAEGNVAIPAKLLRAAVAAMPGESIRLTYVPQERGVALASERMTATLNGMDARDFPKRKGHGEMAFVAVDAPTFLAALDGIAFAMSTDETRYHLNGFLLSVRPERTQFVATDGHRLSVIEPRIDRLPLGERIVRRDTVVLLRRLLAGREGSVEVGFTTGHIHFRIGSMEIASELAEASYPPFEQVIPKTHDTACVIDRLALIAAVERVATFSNERIRGVKLTLDGGERLHLVTESPDEGSGSDEVQLVEFTGPPLTIGVNATYLLDQLRSMTEEGVRIQFADAMSPIKIIGVGPPADRVGVIMPIRI